MAAQGQGTAEPVARELGTVALVQETAELVALRQAMSLGMAALVVQGQGTAGPVAREQETVALGLAEQAAREQETVVLGLAEQAAREPEQAGQVVQGQAMAGPVEQEHNPGPGIDRNYVQHLIQISVHFQHRTLDRGKQSCAGIPEPKTA
ncbi:hypothetical protein GGH14_006876, partial [Coemansia sp. RSA 370]